MRGLLFCALAALLTAPISCTPAHVLDHRARQDLEEARLTALEETPGADADALAALERLAGEATTRPVAARAAVRAGDRHRDAGRGAIAARWWHLATRLDPQGGWARAAVERLHDSWRDQTPTEQERRLRTLRHPALEGMLLYLAAAGHGDHADGRARAVELCLLQRLRTPRSPYRDDCEDLVLSLLDRADRVRFAEDLLLPLPSDDPAAMDSPRFQRIELDLADDLAAAGATDEAVRRYRRVVDRYPSVRLKDDALWRLAGLHRSIGDAQGEGAALRTLIENLPHSRYAPEAQERLEEIGD
jgi:hypothetical protein